MLYDCSVTMVMVFVEELMLILLPRIRGYNNRAILLAGGGFPPVGFYLLVNVVAIVTLEEWTGSLLIVTAVFACRFRVGSCLFERSGGDIPPRSKIFCFLLF
jgi:hypothetical protein